MYDKDVLLLKALKDKTAMLKSVGVKPLKKDIKNSNTLPNRSTKSSCHHVLYTPGPYIMRFLGLGKYRKN